MASHINFSDKIPNIKKAGTTAIIPAADYLGQLRKSE